MENIHEYFLISNQNSQIDKIATTIFFMDIWKLTDRIFRIGLIDFLKIILPIYYCTVKSVFTSESIFNIDFIS